MGNGVTVRKHRLLIGDQSHNTSRRSRDDPVPFVTFFPYPKGIQFIVISREGVHVCPLESDGVFIQILPRRAKSMVRAMDGVVDLRPR